MLTVYTEQHRLHCPEFEVFGGRMITPFEGPERADTIAARLRDARIGELVEPKDFGLAPISRVHSRPYLDFFQSCWAEWKAAGFEGEAIATVMPSRQTGERCPSFIEGKLGYFAGSGESAIMAGTWDASVGSAHVALTAAQAVIDGAGSAFALCRPPGHHCMSNKFGGYCYLNNAAIATQYFRDHGSDRVGILDVDFHHGNGTQEIFYRRDDILFCSIHGDPNHAYPFYLGYADETGDGPGAGYNHNFPLPKGTSFAEWLTAFDDAVSRILAFAPDRLVVSLGVDAFENDPQSFFGIASEDFLEIGRRIAGIGLPTLFVMEGGYAFGPIGDNVLNVLAGFERAAG